MIWEEQWFRIFVSSITILKATLKLSNLLQNKLHKEAELSHEVFKQNLKWMSYNEIKFLQQASLSFISLQVCVLQQHYSVMHAHLSPNTNV